MRVLWMATALIVGCAGARPPGPARTWLELESEHFSVTTDLDRATAIATARSLELLWRALESHYALLIPGTQEAPARRLKIVHLTSCPETVELVGALGLAFQQELIISCGEEPEGSQALLLHELTHAFNRVHFGILPRWLEEGLAELFSTLRVHRGEVFLAERPKTHDHQMIWPTVPMLRSREYAFYARANSAYSYESAWALVHLLTSHSADYHARFVHYLGELRQGGISEEAAWTNAFGSLAVGEIEESHQYYGQREKLTRFRKRWSWGTAPSVAKVGVLGRGQAEMIWGLLRAIGASRRGRPLAEVHAIMAEAVTAAERDPTWTDRLKERAELARATNVDEALALLDQHLAAHPDDVDALTSRIYIRVDQLVGDDEAEIPPATPPAGLTELEPLVARLSRRATEPRHLTVLARYYLVAGKPDVAVVFGTRAVELERRCINCLEVLAAIEHVRGHDDRALAYIRRACAVVERTRTARERKLLERYGGP